MNWIAVLTRNNLRLTQAAIDSFRKQDIGDVRILVVDNDSTDGSVAWLNTQRDLHTIFNSPQRGVAAGWNQALKWIFSAHGGNAEYALVVNNDAILRPDALRWLVADGGGFVTCVGSDDPEKIKPVELGAQVAEHFIDSNGIVTQTLRDPVPYPPPDPAKKRSHPDFSCYLIRRWVWEKVGPFDECFEGAFCEDGSYHLRMHRAGIKAEALELPFYHFGSATIKKADFREQRRIANQAHRNREIFKRMYGVEIGSPEYYALFGNTAPEP